MTSMIDEEGQGLENLYQASNQFGNQNSYFNESVQPSSSQQLYQNFGGNQGGGFQGFGNNQGGNQNLNNVINMMNNNQNNAKPPPQNKIFFQKPDTVADNLTAVDALDVPDLSTIDTNLELPATGLETMNAQVSSQILGSASFKLLDNSTFKDSEGLKLLCDALNVSIVTWNKTNSSNYISNTLSSVGFTKSAITSDIYKFVLSPLPVALKDIGSFFSKIFGKGGVGMTALDSACPTPRFAEPIFASAAESPTLTQNSINIMGLKCVTAANSTILPILNSPFLTNTLSFLTYEPSFIATNVQASSTAVANASNFAAYLNKNQSYIFRPYYELFMTIARFVNARVNNLLRERNLESGRFNFAKQIEKVDFNKFNLPPGFRAATSSFDTDNFLALDEANKNKYAQRTDLNRTNLQFIKSYWENLKGKYGAGVIDSMKIFQNAATTANVSLVSWLNSSAGAAELAKTGLNWDFQNKTIYYGFGNTKRIFFKFPVNDSDILSSENKLDNFSLGKEQIVNTMNKELISLVEAAKYAGFNPRVGPLTKNGKELYIGVFVDPYTGKARLPPKPSRKFVNPIDRRELVEYKISKFIYAWNQKEREAWSLAKLSSETDKEWLARVRKGISSRLNLSKQTRDWVLKRATEVRSGKEFWGSKPSTDLIAASKKPFVTDDDFTNFEDKYKIDAKAAEAELGKKISDAGFKGQLSPLIKYSYARKSALGLDLPENKLINKVAVLTNRTIRKDGTIDLQTAELDKLRDTLAADKLDKALNPANPPKFNVSNSTLNLVNYLYGTSGGIAKNVEKIPGEFYPGNANNLTSLTKNQILGSTFVVNPTDFLSVANTAGLNKFNIAGK